MKQLPVVMTICILLLGIGLGYAQKNPVGGGILAENLHKISEVTSSLDKGITFTKLWSGKFVIIKIYSDGPCRALLNQTDNPQDNVLIIVDEIPDMHCIPGKKIQK